MPFFTDEVWIPVIGGNYSLDVFTILAGLFAFNFYSLAVIRDEKPLYPYGELNKFILLRFQNLKTCFLKSLTASGKVSFIQNSSKSI